eukprot:CAMPEP_0173460500 /NCGR_PEP_ID=MMETSP1357-20121228/63262_1 /TAXON_ID=77926 /ORGANISM="Hemiselmis rufescens, Strain PCC563" /LENGTH=82 /DNA_ID=CAMNT_0014428069 /DNA_START=61 /DNA_END=309 /DNA_ORIENTATION=+
MQHKSASMESGQDALDEQFIVGCVVFEEVGKVLEAFLPQIDRLEMRQDGPVRVDLGGSLDIGRYPVGVLPPITVSHSRTVPT